MNRFRARVAEQLELALARDPELHAFIRTLDERALRDAERLDAGWPDGSPRGSGQLTGVTVSLKDNIDVEGVPSTAGSAYRGERPADVDATVTRLLRRAGAVLVAKNNMAEFAMGATGRNAAFGDCRNAVDPARISGGSSSGSAVAVAAGLSAASLGTDTGGSGRVPAAVNGIVGIRPTLGRVSNHGVLPVSPSFDTIAPLARDVRTAAGVLAVIDRFDAADPRSVAGTRIPVDALLDAGAAGLRVGVPSNFFLDGVEAGVLGVVLAAVEELHDRGAQLVEVLIPDAEQAQERMLDIMYPEAAQVHAERLRTAPETIDGDVLRRLRIGERTPTARTERARRWMTGFRHRVDAVFETVDVIATPTIPVDVPLRGDVDLAAATREIARFTYPWSMYGGPSITVPCGVHPGSGMPVGLQLTAAWWHEHVLLRAAAASRA